MIAGTGWEARLRLGEDNVWAEPVVFFDDEGEPWIAPEHRMLRARDFSNYEGIQPTSTPVVAAFPVTGLRYWSADHDDGVHRRPVIGVAVRANGICEPIVADEGEVLLPVVPGECEPVDGWPDEAEP